MNNILKLITKDLIFIKGAMKLQLLIGILFVVIFPIADPSLATIGAILVPYFLVYGTMAYEERSKGEVLNATLPVSRSEICLSKYGSALFYSVVSALGTALTLRLGAKFLPSIFHQAYQDMPIMPVVGMSLIISIIYVAVMLPIIFKFGTEKSRIIMLVLYMGAFFSLSVISEIFLEVFTAVPMVGIVLGVVLVYIVSVSVGLKIYNNKAFH